MAESTFIAVVSDTNPSNNGRSYNMTISGNNMSQFLGKKIGDMVKVSSLVKVTKLLLAHKLQITGGSDKTGTPMRSDLDGAQRQSFLLPHLQDSKGHTIEQKTRWRKRNSDTNQME